MRKGFLITAGLISLSLLLFAFYVFFIQLGPKESIVYISNKTGEKIIGVEVSICDSTWNHQNLAADADVTIRYAADCEGEIFVNARLASGKIVKQGIGYVNTGFSNKDRVTITAEGLVIEGL